MPFFSAIAANKATTMGHIQRYHLSEWTLAMPSPRILEVADSVIGPFFDLINQNEKQLYTLQAVRDTLLPKLVSGEIRVSEAAQLVEAHV
jgi:type I restriction enzyme S subunit